MFSELSFISVVVIAACGLLASVTFVSGYQWLKPQPINIRISRTRHQISGILLLSSAFAWAILSWQFYTSNHPSSMNNLASLQQIESLPPTASGEQIRPVNLAATGLNDHQPSEMAKMVAGAEEMAARPYGVNFQSLRKKVTNMLLKANNFDKNKELVNIDLSQDDAKDAIKYIVEERPGLLTIVYKQQTPKGPKMVVYFPEVTGNQLIYTPLYGAGASLPKVVQK
jgi:hypothetical protein